MPRQRRQADTTSRAGTVVRGAVGRALHDAGSAQLEKIAGRLGNGRTNGLVGDSLAKAEALMQFIEERLAALARAQEEELREADRRKDWRHEVGRGEPGFNLPDATRWGRPALLYRRAAEALGSGHLGRAAELLEQALEADRAALGAVPGQVDLDRADRVPARAPDALPFVEAGEGSLAVNAGSAVRAADAILKVARVADPVPVPPNERLHAWWLTEEDEEEAADEGEKKRRKGEA
jgi:hypothetical protein